ncbi:MULTISPECIES: GerAB/ArcD/ProY family transporter [Paenibacillus]|uniref:GerAB/ArcD/ProY family transporter n=1 Tax=Paenibacillus TaxID=44249 RepID=UPI0022B8B070|nr:endospore germination permease [Paenibacillus caseinilyticus]MCZ8524030.1 endospore germination permease [Paenibacillus caseinilyticus]
MSNTVIVINHRQLAWLIGSMMTGGGLIAVQHELVKIAKMDAWFSYLLPTFYVLLIAFVLAQLSRRFPQMNLFEIIMKVFGRIAGTLVNLLLVAHLWMILMRDTRALSKFINTMLLPNTPEEILVTLLFLLLMFYGRTSVEVIARVNDLFFPLFFCVIILLPLLLSNELNKYLIQPVLTSEPLQLWYTNILGIGWYGDLLLVGAFLHTIWNAKQLQSAFRHGSIIATCLLSLFLFMEIVVLGPSMPANMIYPNYMLVQHIHVTDFLDRIDLVILSIWFPILACKIILTYLALLTGLASLLRQRDYTFINSPVSLLLLLTSLLAFKSTTEVHAFGNYSSPVIILAYQPLLLAALLIGMRRFPVRPETENPNSSSGESSSKPRSSNSIRSGGGGGGSPGARMQQGFKRVTYGHLVWSSNGLLALSALFVGAGLLLGKSYAPVGVAGAIGFTVCLLLSLLTTHLEMKRAAQPQS